MPLLAVNYHYIGMPDFPYNGVNGVSHSEFLNHVDYLKNNFILIGLSDLTKIDINKNNYCLITFDDGLLCHYETVFNEMKKNNFPAAFFINTMPLVTGNATAIHKLHIVRAKIQSKIILNELVDYCKQKDISIPKTDEIFLLSVYSYDTIEDSRLKYIINYHLTELDRNVFINRLFKSLYAEETEFVEEWYMNDAHIKEMNDYLICIGSHAHSHLALAKLNDNDIIDELALSKKIIENIIGNKIDCFSYPSGGKQAVTLGNARLVKEIGFNYAFSMEREQNITMDYPQMLARIDCNDLPVVGKSPRFYLKNNKLYRLDNSFSRRKRYFDE